MEKILEKTLTSEEMIEKARRFAFSVYDINCDGYVDTIDMFSFIKDQKHNEKMLSQAAYRDIIDI